MDTSHPAPTQELEVCFALAGEESVLTPKALGNWDRLSSIAPRRKSLNAVYFDTSDFLLTKSRIGLRIRRDSGRWEQTFKAETNGLDRIEHNHLLAQRTASPIPSIDPSGLPATPELEALGLKRSQIATLTSPEGLQVQFEVKVTRHTWRIRINESELEVAFDQGTLLADEKSREVQEIELELVSGRRLDLWLASQELSDHLARSSRKAFIESRSKAQRGMGLLDPEFLLAKPPKVRASGDTATIVATHLQRTAQWLSLEIARVLESRDPEGTHSARVAIRQLRTSLKLLEACGQGARVASLIEEARWLADALGKLRDLDVAIEKVVDPILAVLRSDRDLIACQAVIDSRREAIRAELRATLTKERSREFLIQLFKLSEELPGLFGLPPAEQIAREQSALLLQKVKRRRKRAIDPESRHRLRLAYKALRYATPILVQLGGDERLLDAAKDAAKQQDTLGDEQDRAVMWNTLSGALMSQVDSLKEEQRQHFLDLARGFLIGLSTSDQG